MECPICGRKAKVIDTRYSTNNRIYRKRRCSECGYDFLTIESEVFVDERIMEEWNNCERKRIWEFKKAMEDWKRSD